MPARQSPCMHVSQGSPGQRESPRWLSPSSFSPPAAGAWETACNCQSLSLVLAAGDCQAGEVGTSLAQPLSAILVDQSGHGPAGRTVHFVVDSGDVVGLPVISDASGKATARWSTNHDGALGDGTTQQRSFPVPVIGFPQSIRLPRLHAHGEESATATFSPRDSNVT